MKTPELHRTAELLTKKGVDYRVIGSHAVSLYGIERPHPARDIDLLVQRSDLRAIPDVRHALRDEFNGTAVLGTYAGMKTIDFDSDGETALTHNALRVPTATDTFRAVERDGITTLDPQTLHDLYGTVGGVIRRRDHNDRIALAVLGDGYSDPAFEEFNRLRENHYPKYIIGKVAVNALTKAIPHSVKLPIQDRVEEMLEARYE